MSTQLAHTENHLGRTHVLTEHLTSVGELAARFAASFDDPDSPTSARIHLARWVGLLHDLGKYRDAFQNYLLGISGKRGDIDTRHAIYGAALVECKGSSALAFAIAGHHAGLHDLSELQNQLNLPAYDLKERVPEIAAQFERDLLPLPEMFDAPEATGDHNAEDVLVRMLFSALVDADFLDTEAHYAARQRKQAPLFDADEMLARLSTAKNEKAERSRAAESYDEARTLGTLRESIYAKCVAAGDLPRGFFNLTVPTGGGKTLAGMAFALAHARQHSLRRVIVVIPYLSIIEQNAAEYRRILDPRGEGIVIENHSAVVIPSREDEADEGMRSPFELAAENWDAPVVVTTAVQFVESLFAARPARCRKLHNIARSVVIFDEAQTLPARLLNPLLSVMRELREDYGVSFLFSTATQPAFRRTNALSKGFAPDEVLDLIENAPDVYRQLRRVQYELPQASERRSWREIAAEMRAEPRSLCLVNVRRHARALWNELQSDSNGANAREGLFHLSSAMCAAHRSHVIGEMHDPREGSIRWRLGRGLPCRVVSTQLIEAGVDLDFPFVLRALAPLDSLVQAAGRCNREGRLRDENNRARLGRVVVFNPEDEGLPRGLYQTATQVTAALLARLDAETLATDPDIFAGYFKSLAGLINTDEEDIENERRKLNFRTVARKARVIIDEGTGVIVPYNREARELIDKVRADSDAKRKPFIERKDMRRLQRFTVNLRRNDFDTLHANGQIRHLFPLFKTEVYVLDAGSYHENLGVLVEGRPAIEMIL